MIRVLTMIAITGFFVSIACLTGAFAIGGHDAIARGGWGWDWDGERAGFSRHDGGWRSDGPESTRDLPWSGTAMVIELPADVRYVQSDGPAKLTVTGPASVVKDVVVENGHITLPGHHVFRRSLQVVLTAPGVNTFEQRASGDVSIEGYHQATLNLDLSGSGDVTVKGETTTLQLDLSGSGDADLEGLKTARAKVDVSGSGDASIAPREWADLDISGSGDINLLSRPAHLETDVSGSGSLRQDDADRDDDAPASAPAPPKPPGKSV